MQALVYAAATESGDPESDSFFGALLTVRLGVAGLRAHVAEVMQRLQTMQIQGSDYTLFDALLFVAACHGCGIPGIDEHVLADLLGVPEDWLYTRVVMRLGDEAAAVRGGGNVLTRHVKVAQAILLTAEEAFKVDITEVWKRIVHQTVDTSRRVHVNDTHALVLHAGPRLQHSLPTQMSANRRAAIAIAAARASVKFKSEWLGCVVDLGNTLRIAERYDDAVSVFRNGLADAHTKADFSQKIRGYWHEWGTCEGNRSTIAPGVADTWIQGLAISDLLSPAEITFEQAKRACSGLGVAFGKLADQKNDSPYAKARRAVAYLGRLSHPDETSLGHLNTYDRLGDEANTPKAKNIDEAIEWLSVGVSNVGMTVTDMFLRKLATPSLVTFKQLAGLLGNHSAR